MSTPVDWKALAGKLTASSGGGCTTDGAMISRSAAWGRREQILRLQRKRELEAARIFTFRARRPFHPERIYTCLTRGLASKCRLEGVAWIASRNDEHATVLHPPSKQLGSASMSVSITRGPPWWASTDRSEWPDGLAEELLNSKLWDETYGDRQIEIRVSLEAAQTTPRLDRDSIEKELLSCLLTDAELDEGVEVWDEMYDPFLEKEQSAPFSFGAAVGGVMRDMSAMVCRPCDPVTTGKSSVPPQCDASPSGMSLSMPPSGKSTVNGGNRPLVLN